MQKEKLPNILPQIYRVYLKNGDWIDVQATSLSAVCSFVTKNEGKLFGLAIIESDNLPFIVPRHKEWKPAEKFYHA